MSLKLTNFDRWQRREVFKYTVCVDLSFNLSPFSLWSVTCSHASSIRGALSNAGGRGACHRLHARDSPLSRCFLAVYRRQLNISATVGVGREGQCVGQVYTAAESNRQKFVAWASDL